MLLDSRILICANGETLPLSWGQSRGKPFFTEPVSTIPRKGSRADFVTVRNGVPTIVGKI